MSDQDFHLPQVTLIHMDVDAEVSAQEQSEAYVGRWRIGAIKITDAESELQFIENLILRRQFGDPEVDEVLQFVQLNRKEMPALLDVTEKIIQIANNSDLTEEADYLRKILSSFRLAVRGEGHLLELRSFVVLNLIDVLSLQLISKHLTKWDDARNILARATILPRLNKATLRWILEDNLEPLPALPKANVIQIALVADAAILINDTDTALEALQTLARVEPACIELWTEAAIRVCDFLLARNALPAQLSNFVSRLSEKTWGDVGDDEF